MEALLVLALLACPVGMGAMVWWMNRGMKQQAQPVAQLDNVDELRAEQARLTAEIDQLQTERAARSTRSAS